MAHCLLSFGSNLGDRFQRIVTAAREIEAHPSVRQFTASRLFETPPIGGPQGQSPFLNGVALIETAASAREVLELLQKLELDLGRQRAQRWDARSIDLDVVLYGDLRGNSANLSVPHPRYPARRFVLLPADEIAGQWIDPRFGWSIHQMAQHLEVGVPSMSLVGGSRALREQLCRDLSQRHGILTFLDPDKPIAFPEQTPEPWVSSFLPPLPTANSQAAAAATTPRLVGHLQWTTPESRWPATHQIWQTSFQWPEYRLEVDAHDWAVNELASALDSMGCPLQPVTLNGLWHKLERTD
ncbi:2-amino-4-hydroxy-6-hydroxymethyldihydropteridine diphosphokinase [Planctomycetaceae bacterium SH139]